MEPQSPVLKSDDIRISINEIVLRSSSRGTFGVQIVCNGDVFEYEPFQKDTVHKWTAPRCLVKFPFSDLKRLSDASLKIVNSKRKVIASTILPISDLVKSHASYDSSKEDNIYMVQWDKSTKSAAIVVKSELFSPSHFLSLLMDRGELFRALKDLESLAKSKEYHAVSKATSYLSEELLQAFWSYISAPNVDEAAVAAIFSCMQALCDNLTTRQHLIRLHVVELIFCGALNGELASSPSAGLVQPRVLACLRPFFSSPKHQKYLIDQKMDSILVQLISPRTCEPAILALLDTLRYFDVSHIRTLVKLGVLKRLFKLYTHNETCSSNMVLKFVDFVSFIGPEFREEIVQSKVSGLFPWFTTNHPEAFVRLKLIESQRTFGFQTLADETGPSSASVAAALVKSYDPLADGATKLRILAELSKETLLDDVNERDRVALRSGAVDLFSKCLRDPNPLIFECALSYFHSLKGITLPELASSGYIESLKEVLMNTKTPMSSCVAATKSLCDLIDSERSLASQYDLAPALSSAICKESFPEESRRDALSALCNTDSRTMYEALIKRGSLTAAIKLAAGQPDTDASKLFLPFLELMIKALSHRSSRIDSEISRVPENPPQTDLDEQNEIQLLTQFETVCKTTPHLPSFAQNALLNPNIVSIAKCAIPILLEHHAAMEKLSVILRFLPTDPKFADLLVSQSVHHSILVSARWWMIDSSNRVALNMISSLTIFIRAPRPIFEQNFVRLLLNFLIEHPLGSVPDLTGASIGLWRAVFANTEYAALVVESGAPTFLLGMMAQPSGEQIKSDLPSMIATMFDSIVAARVESVSWDRSFILSLAKNIDATPLEQKRHCLKIIHNFLLLSPWTEQPEEVQAELNTSFFVHQMFSIMTMFEPSHYSIVNLTTAAWDLFKYWLDSIRPHLSTESSVSDSEIIGKLESVFNQNRHRLNWTAQEEAAHLLLRLSSGGSLILPSLQSIVQTKDWHIPQEKDANQRYVIFLFRYFVKSLAKRESPLDDSQLLQQMAQPFFTANLPFGQVQTYLETRNALLKTSPATVEAARDPLQYVIDPCLPPFDPNQVFLYYCLLEILKMLPYFTTQSVFHVLPVLARLSPHNFVHSSGSSAPLAAAFIDCAIKLWIDNNQKLDVTAKQFIDAVYKPLIELSDDPCEFLPAMKYSMFAQIDSYASALESKIHRQRFVDAKHLAEKNADVAAALCGYLYPLPFHTSVHPEADEIARIVLETHAASSAAFAAATRLKKKLNGLKNAPIASQLENISQLANQAPTEGLYRNAHDILASVDWSFLEESSEDSSSS